MWGRLNGKCDATSQVRRHAVASYRRQKSKTPKCVTTASSELMLNATGDDVSVALHGSAMAPDGTGVHRDAIPQANAQRRITVSVPTVQPEHMVFHYRKAPSQAWRWYAQPATRQRSGPSRHELLAVTKQRRPVIDF
jgi:hypothetical protein